MAIDKTKFKRTSAAQMQQADANVNRTLGKKERGDNLSFDDGMNLIRIYPPHPEEDGGGDQFAEPIVTAFVPAIVQEKDKQGNLIWLDNAKTRPKMKETVRPVFNSKIHGGTKKDLLEEYIRLALAKAKDLYGNDKFAREKFLEPIYGNFSKNINGINYQTKWKMYVDKYPNADPDQKPTFGPIEIKKAVKTRLNKIAAMEAGNDPMGYEPFTDIEEGRAVKVNYNKDAEKADDYYTTELDMSSVEVLLQGGKKGKVTRTYPLSEEQLEKFMQVTPLAKILKGVFKRKDFETQYEGIVLLEKKHNLGVIESEEWADLVEEISEYYPEEEDNKDQQEQGGQQNQNAGTTNSTASDEVEEEEEEDDEVESGTEGDEDEFTLLDRSELKAYAKEKKTGIVVMKNMSDDDIRVALRNWKKAAEIPHIPLPGEEGYKEEAKETPAAGVTQTTKVDVSAKLNSLKDRFKKS